MIEQIASSEGIAKSRMPPAEPGFYPEHALAECLRSVVTPPLGRCGPARQYPSPQRIFPVCASRGPIWRNGPSVVGWPESRAVDVVREEGSRLPVCQAEDLPVTTRRGGATIHADIIAGHRHLLAGSHPHPHFHSIAMSVPSVCGKFRSIITPCCLTQSFLRDDPKLEHDD